MSRKSENYTEQTRNSIRPKKTRTRNSRVTLFMSLYLLPTVSVPAANNLYYYFSSFGGGGDRLLRQSKLTGETNHYCRRRRTVHMHQQRRDWIPAIAIPPTVDTCRDLPRPGPAPFPRDWVRRGAGGPGLLLALSSVDRPGTAVRRGMDMTCRDMIGWCREDGVSVEAPKWEGGQETATCRMQLLRRGRSPGASGWGPPILGPAPRISLLFYFLFYLFLILSVFVRLPFSEILRWTSDTN